MRPDLLRILLRRRVNTDLEAIDPTEEREAALRPSRGGGEPAGRSAGMRWVRQVMESVTAGLVVGWLAASLVQRLVF